MRGEPEATPRALASVQLSEGTASRQSIAPIFGFTRTLPMMLPCGLARDITVITIKLGKMQSLAVWRLLRQLVKKPTGLGGCGSIRVRERADLAVEPQHPLPLAAPSGRPGWLPALTCQSSCAVLRTRSPAARAPAHAATAISLTLCLPDGRRVTGLRS